MSIEANSIIAIFVAQMAMAGQGPPYCDTARWIRSSLPFSSSVNT